VLPTQVASSYIVESLNIFLSNINGDSKGSLPKMFFGEQALAGCSSSLAYSVSDHQYDKLKEKSVKIATTSDGFGVDRKFVRGLY